MSTFFENLYGIISEISDEESVALSAYSLPTYDDPYYKYRIKIANDEYILKWFWNDEGEFWSVGFYDLAEKPILKPVKIVPDVNLTGQYSYKKDLPPVVLFCIGKTGTTAIPNQLSLQDDYLVAYFDF